MGDFDRELTLADSPDIATFMGLLVRQYCRNMTSMHWATLFFCLWTGGFCFGRNLPLDVKPNEDVLRLARSYSDGGKYHWSGSGTPEAIIFHGKTILPASRNGTYCSGFTFAVVMRAATDRGLLEKKKVEQIRRFQREWYGATKRSSEVQAGYAMKNLGIGQTVRREEAQSGDFVQFWRTKKNSGHSVVFLDWIYAEGEQVGFRYRSTQESTDGIGDRTEYFSDVAHQKGEVIRQRTYFARLNPK